MHQTIRREEAEKRATREELQLIDELGGIHRLAKGGVMHRVVLGTQSRYVHVTKPREHNTVGQQTTLHS